MVCSKSQWIFLLFFRMTSKASQHWMFSTLRTSCLGWKKSCANWRKKSRSEWISGSTSVGCVVCERRCGISRHHTSFPQERCRFIPSHKASRFLGCGWGSFDTIHKASVWLQVFLGKPMQLQSVKHRTLAADKTCDGEMLKVNCSELPSANAIKNFVWCCRKKPVVPPPVFAHGATEPTAPPVAQKETAGKSTTPQPESSKSSGKKLATGKVKIFMHSKMLERNLLCIVPLHPLRLTQHWFLFKALHKICDCDFGPLQRKKVQPPLSPSNWF